MKLIQLTCAAALLLSASTLPAAAQDSMTDKAKDVAVDQAEKYAKKKVKSEMSGTTAVVGEKAVGAGADMIKGKSVGDAAMGAMKSEGKTAAGTVVGGSSLGSVVMDKTGGSMSTGEMVTAGKVMAKGGSVQDATMEVGKQRMKTKAKSYMKDQAGKMMTGQTVTTTAPTHSPAPMSQPTVTRSTAPIACPAGTTAQPNGTCMITGNYNPS